MVLEFLVRFEGFYFVTSEAVIFVLQGAQSTMEIRFIRTFSFHIIFKLIKLVVEFNDSLVSLLDQYLSFLPLDSLFLQKFDERIDFAGQADDPVLMLGSFSISVEVLKFHPF